ncbi:MAG TPA: Cache 3/Cache 2 fusion domain-containing protein, partial [Spirochaetota bacterium]|nr:Cache 3/Cache 2 fusion domain-containing protein [Spirochaetota bacterium]
MAKKEKKIKEKKATKKEIVSVENNNEEIKKTLFDNIKEKLTSFSTKILLLLIFSIISSSFFTGIIGIYNMSSLSNSVLKKTLTEKLESDLKIIKLFIREEYGSISYSEDDEMLVDSEGESLDDRHELVDRISNELGNNATVFLRVEEDFKRISTNIKGDDGKRAVGTNLERDNGAYEAVLEGKTYIGETKILNK